MTLQELREHNEGMRYPNSGRNWDQNYQGIVRRMTLGGHTAEVARAYARQVLGARQPRPG